MLFLRKNNIEVGFNGIMTFALCITAISDVCMYIMCDVWTYIDDGRSTAGRRLACLNTDIVTYCFTHVTVHYASKLSSMTSEA